MLPTFDDEISDNDGTSPPDDAPEVSDLGDEISDNDGTYGGENCNGNDYLLW